MSNNTSYPFGNPYGSSFPNPIAYDPNVSKAYPGLILTPSEAGGVYTVFREVNGCSWWAINADWNPNTNQWEQDSPANAALPAYAIEQCQDGSMNRLVAAATIVPGTTVNWVTVMSMDSHGNINFTPTTNTLSTQLAQQINAIWNAGTSTVMNARGVNIIDSSSASNSNLDNLSVNGTQKWVVQKDGTLTVGNIPFARITGYTPPSFNNVTLTGTTTMTGDARVEGNLEVDGTSDLKGAVLAESGLTVQNGLGVTGGILTDTLHVTGNEQVDGNINVNGSVTAASFKDAAGDLQSALPAYTTSSFVYPGTGFSFTVNINANYAIVEGQNVVIYSGNSSSVIVVYAQVFTINSTNTPPATNLTLIAGTANVTIGATVPSGQLLSPGGGIFSLISSDSSIKITPASVGVNLQAVQTLPGTIFRQMYRPLDADTFPHTYTMSLPQLPGTSSNTYALYAHANVNLQGSGTMTLTGGTGTWGSAASQTDSGTMLQYIDLAGTATGGQIPSVALFISGLGTENTPHSGYFILEAVPFINATITNPDANHTVIS